MNIDRLTLNLFVGFLWFCNFLAMGCLILKSFGVI